MIGVQSPRFPFGAEETRSRPAWSGSASSSRSRSTPSTSSGAPTAARAGRASSSGASAAHSPGSTSARANTWRRRSRSRRSCARSTPCGPARADGAAAPDRRPRRPGDRPHPGGLPRRLLGAALDRRRGRRGAGARVRGRRRLRDGRGRGRDRGRARRRGPASRSRSPDPGLYALAEHPSHEAHRLILRPTPGLRIWSVSFAAGTPGKGEDHDHQARFRRHSLHRRRPLPRVLRRDARPAPRRQGPATSSGSATPASASGSRPSWAWSSRRRRTPTPPSTSTTLPPPAPSWRRRASSSAATPSTPASATWRFFTDPDGNDLMLHHRYAPRD